MSDSITIPSPFDAHVHLRQGAMQKLVVPHVRQGGMTAAFVMPNTIPPLSTPDAAVEYGKQLKALDSSVNFLLSMYLTRDLTPEHIRQAKEAGIAGVKSYPRGVTTNSDGGVGMEGYAVYDEVFAEMEKQDIVLNLHGEVPSDIDGDGTCVMNAEERFLPHLREINRKFPRLRIVLEHCTTAAAIECVKSLPSNVVATITPHHLLLTIDAAVSSGLNFCKPVAKYPDDRTALRSAISSGNPKFFLGSDSAPHPASSKIPALLVTKSADGKETVALSSPCAAGIYTSAELLPLLAHTFEKSGIPLDKLEGFASAHGRAFYRLESRPEDAVTLRRTSRKVPSSYPFASEKGEDRVIPFLAGQDLGWEIVRN